MLVGSLGEIPFVVSHDLIRTFDDYKRSNTGRWAKHELIGSEPVLEFLGQDTEKISFNMLLRAEDGLKPEEELQKLRKLLKDGEASILILADRPVGENSWIIESIGESVNFWDAFGNATSISIDVSLQEYKERLVI